MQAHADTVVRSFLNVNLGKDALPWPILAILLIGIFGTTIYAIKKVGDVKKYLGEPPFPTQILVTIAGVFGFIVLILVAASRLALGMNIPDGFDVPFYAVLGMCGVAGLWGVGKHAYSAEREAAKTTAALSFESAKNAVSPSPPLQMNVGDGGSATVQNAPQPTATAERPIPAPAKMPFGGVSNDRA